MYRPTRGPVGENAQENIAHGFEWQNSFLPPWNPFAYNQDRGHTRSAPAEPPFVEYSPSAHTWHQGGRRLPSSFVPKKYWARPCDGKRRGAWGRLKDGLTGEGADVFVVMNGDRRTLHRDLPHRPQWSRWEGAGWDPNVGRWVGDRDATEGEAVHGAAPWARRGGERYNFFTREYEDAGTRGRNHAGGRLWTDAHWPEGAGRRDMNPWSFRVEPWGWSTRVPWGAGFAPGGRPRPPWAI